jgi:hypothetical protein
VAACLLLVLSAACSGAGSSKGPSRPPFVGEDLRYYYPGINRYQTQYLQGDDYWNGGPRLAVLWFERRDQRMYRVYNYPPGSPQARCGYDELTWTDEGYLRYSRTVTECGPQPTELVYDPPITYLPQYWHGRPWSQSGQSVARYSIGGRLRCVGIANWTNEVLGVDRIAPGDPELHARLSQTTTWVTGDVTGSCFANTVLNWREDYWLTAHLPDPDGVPRGNGLHRTVGGNLDSNRDYWDIRIARWAPLPR